MNKDTHEKINKENKEDIKYIINREYVGKCNFDTLYENIVEKNINKKLSQMPALSGFGSCI